ncbi:MAG: hypothetical protein AB7P69_23050 [Candidatus Binatia bacterium]
MTVMLGAGPTGDRRRDPVDRACQHRPEKTLPPFVHSSSFLVMLVEPDVHDVVPTGRVVALETLVHTRVLLAGELQRDHREVTHEMTRRQPLEHE